mmetsp:Transcript_19214/g.62742  ORF Transcript_19214/g.62742 Transcript_19214/m.62742 type:complete len:205 (+) Transcript_19214:234-848(+)
MGYCGDIRAQPSRLSGPAASRRHRLQVQRLGASVGPQLACAAPGRLLYSARPRADADAVGPYTGTGLADRGDPRFQDHLPVRLWLSPRPPARLGRCCRPGYLGRTLRGACFPGHDDGWGRGACRPAFAGAAGRPACARRAGAHFRPAALIHQLRRVLHRRHRGRRSVRWSLLVLAQSGGSHTDALHRRHGLVRRLPRAGIPLPP